MSLAHPLLLILLVIPIWLLLRNRKGSAVPVGDAALPAAAARRAWLPWFPPVLRALALAAWIVARFLSPRVVPGVESA